MDYLTLAFFAEYGWWPSQEQVFYGLPPNGQMGVNPLNEAGIPAALPPQVTTTVDKPGCVSGPMSREAEFVFRYTNSLFNGHEVCDCYEFGSFQGPHDVNNSTENRIYIKGNTTISYFQWFGDIVAPRGTFDVSPLLRIPAKTHAQQCPVGQFPGNWAWNMPVKEFLRNVIRHARPTHLVLSTSFWPITPGNTQMWNEIADAGVQAVMDSGGQVMWKTTPQRTDHAPYKSPRVDMAPFLNNGWKLFPAQQIVNDYQGHAASDAIFYDFTHLRPAPQCFLAQNFLETHVCPSAGQK